MNILVCHGCRQDIKTITSLFKKYEKEIKRNYPDSSISYLEGQYDHYDHGKMWYKTCLTLENIGSNDIPENEIQETLDYLESYIRENNINVLIGYSQGGNLVSTYLRLRNEDFHIKSASIISGYDFPIYVKFQMKIKKLVFVYSQSDEIVNHLLKPSINISCVYKDLIHERGHKIEQKSDFVKNFVFLLFY
jgi:poly(3-hydroxyalkanoate) synthetase